MIRTLRGLWSRRGTLLPLLLLTTVVVAGVVAVLSFAEDAGTSSAVAVPLLLLGLVAVPATGRQLAAARRGEIALARLRGLTGGQLHAVLAIEPLLVLVAGSLLGVLLGAAVAAAAGALWVTGGASSPDVTVLPWVAAIVLVGLVAVLVGMAQQLREPLNLQVREQERPRTASVATVFWNVLLVVAAAVAVYRSSVTESAEPDWVVLAGPALVGLVVGQLAVWLVRLATRGVVGASSRGDLAGFLATRRLARVADAATSLRLVVAASVVAAVAATGAQHVADWSEDTARVRAAAPVQVPFDGDVKEALALTRELDPEGEHLMAAAFVPGEGSVPARRFFLDTARYDAVVGDFLDGTPSAGLTRHLAALSEAEGVTLATGDRVEVVVRGVSRRLEGRLRPRVTVSYADGEGRQRAVSVTAEIDLSGEPATASGPVKECAEGCTVTGIRLQRLPGDVELPYVVTGLDFAGVDALAVEWRRTSPAVGFGVPGGPEVVDDGLMAIAGQASQTAVPEASTGPRTPVLATASATWDGPRLVDSPGGDERPADVVDRLPALPLVEADGLLADLPLTAAGAPPTVPAAEVMVLAAADAPAALLDRVAEAGGGTPRTVADIELDVAREVGAVQAQSYALMAGFCLAVAVLVATSTVARQRSAHGREVAVLRLLGVPRSTVRRSTRLELCVLAAVAVAAAALGGLLAVRLLLRNLSLVAVPLHTAPLEIGVAIAPLAGAAVAAAVLVALVSGRGRAVSASLGRPATLREEGAR
jgi:hypothetical protein